jgi:methylglutaconyl-CoA hydratase
VEIKNEKEGLAFFSGFAHVIIPCDCVPKFIIGRIHGKCVGGGVGLAASVDYAIASEAAEVRLSELAIGIGPIRCWPCCGKKDRNICI